MLGAQATILNKPSVDDRVALAAHLFGCWRLVEESPQNVTSTEIANLLDLPIGTVENALRNVGARVGNG